MSIPEPSQPTRCLCVWDCWTSFPFPIASPLSIALWFASSSTYLQEYLPLRSLSCLTGVIVRGCAALAPLRPLCLRVESSGDLAVFSCTMSPNVFLTFAPTFRSDFIWSQTSTLYLFFFSLFYFSSFCITNKWRRLLQPSLVKVEECTWVLWVYIIIPKDKP